MQYIRNQALTLGISKTCMAGSIYLILPSLSYLAEMTFPLNIVTNTENVQKEKTNKNEKIYIQCIDQNLYK